MSEFRLAVKGNGHNMILRVNAKSLSAAKKKAYMLAKSLSPEAFPTCPVGLATLLYNVQFVLHGKTALEKYA